MSSNPIIQVLADLGHAAIDNGIISESNLFFNMDRADFERLPQDQFPRILILINDMTTDEMNYNFNVVNAQVNVIYQYKEKTGYSYKLKDTQKLLRKAKESKDIIHKYFAGQVTGKYEQEAELISSVEQRFGTTQNMITIDNLFTLRYEEEFNNG